MRKRGLMMIDEETKQKLIDDMPQSFKTLSKIFAEIGIDYWDYLGEED